MGTQRRKCGSAGNKTAEKKYEIIHNDMVVVRVGGITLRHRRCATECPSRFHKAAHSRLPVRFFGRLLRSITINFARGRFGLVAPRP